MRLCGMRAMTESCGAWLALAALACTQPRATSPAPSVRCIPISEANAEASRAQQRNQERFKQELAAKGLQLIAFATAGVENREVNEISVERRSVGGVEQQVLLVPTWTCATGTAQFATNAAHELYALEIHELATNAAITACGCQPQTNAMCGGAHVAPQTLLYVVPDELSYKGTTKIEYSVDPVSVLYTGRRTDGTACPVPVPPP